MVILPGDENALKTPTPEEIASTLACLNAASIAPGVWTARLSNGNRIMITDRSSVDVFTATVSVADWLDENHGADNAELAARVMRVSEATGRAVTAWIGATGGAETYTPADVCRELADAALAALVAIESLNGDPAGELAGAAARALARIGGAR